MENFKLPEISFFCPAYNDEKNLPELIPHVFEFLKKHADKFEIIIVDDGAADKTGEVADKLAKRFPFTRVIHHKTNKGYGGALRSGFLETRYDFVMYTDGDNQYDINELELFLPLIKNNDILSGYATKKAVSFGRRVQSIIFNLIIKCLFFINIKDINCSVKVYKRKVLDSFEIKSSSAFIDVEMLVKAKRKGFKIAQFPVTHYERISGVASGSKLNVILPTIVDIFKFRFGLL